MKKFISLLLVLTMLLPLSLTGCQNQNVKNMIKNYKKYDSTGERYDCYLPDYMEIPDFTVFKVPNIKYTATEEIINNYLTRDVIGYSGNDNDNYGKPAKKLDVAQINSTCWFEGEVFKGYTFTNKNGHAIVLGLNELDVPAIDENIIGMMEGETKKFDFTFPDPYYRDLSKSGKTATIEVTLTILSPIKLIEADDSFYAQHFGYSTEHYKAVVKTRLEEQYNGYIETYKSDLVWDYLYENTVIKSYPKERDDMYNSLYEDYRSAALDANLTFLEYVKKKHNCDTIEDFNTYLNNYVDEYCKREMILYFVARAYNLKYTNEYYEKEIMEYVKEFEIDNIEDAESYIEFQVGLDEFKERIQLNYVYEWIGNNAPVAEDVTTYVNDLNKDLK